MSQATQKALQLTSKHGPLELVSNQPIYKPGPGYVLVKILATSLNPVDWKVQEMGIFVDRYPAILGTDIAGEVVELGEGVTRWKKGDKIFFQGTMIAPDNSQGGFQEYTLTEADYAARIPPNVSPEEACCIPVVLAAAVVGLYATKPSGAGLTSPFSEEGKGKYAGKLLVVLGGASSVGQVVIQLARLSGFSHIITTASLKHTDLLKSLGATHVLDRSLSTSELSSQIQSITSTPVTLVYDAVGAGDTQNTGYDLLSSTENGQLIIVMGNLVEKSKITPKKEIVITFGFFFLPATRELGKQVYANLSDLVETGQIKPNSVEVLPGGFSGVVDGLERIKNNQISGKKLVFRPQETA